MSRWIVGQASDFLFHLPDLEEPELPPVVLYVRVSTANQAKDGNLREAVEDATRQLAKLGVDPIKTFKGVEGGRLRDDRPMLGAALAYARRHGAILVAPSRDRFIRGKLAGPACRRHHELPSVAEYRWLLRLADSVALATLIHPDADARGQQTRRGQAAKGRRGGGDRKAGHKKRQRALCRNKVRWMTFVGMSVRTIAAALGEHTTQVQRWKE